MLSADKQYLVESRLLPIARKAGLANFGELVAALRRGDNECLMTMVVEAMITNETLLSSATRCRSRISASTILSSLLAARRASRRIRIWSPPPLPARSPIRSP